MKNIYYLVETDINGECAKIITTFTNKEKAYREMKARQKQRYAANALRKSEGSRERNNNRFLVTTSNKFINDVEDAIFNKVDLRTVLYKWLFFNSIRF